MSFGKHHRWYFCAFQIEIYFEYIFSAVVSQTIYFSYVSAIFYSDTQNTASLTTAVHHIDEPENHDISSQNFILQSDEEPFEG